MARSSEVWTDCDVDAFLGDLAVRTQETYTLGSKENGYKVTLDGASEANTPEAFAAYCRQQKGNKDGVIKLTRKLDTAVGGAVHANSRVRYVDAADFRREAPKLAQGRAVQMPAASNGKPTSAASNGKPTSASV